MCELGARPSVGADHENDVCEGGRRLTSINIEMIVEQVRQVRTKRAGLDTEQVLLDWHSY